MLCCADKTSKKRVLNILKLFQVPERQLAGSAFRSHSGASYNNAHFMNGSIIKSSVSRVNVVYLKMVYLNACITGINNLYSTIKEANFLCQVLSN
jgi:hypothetical protein